MWTFFCALNLLLSLKGHNAVVDVLENDEVCILALPKNMTSKHQPCDQGIIAAIKKRYKTNMLLRMDQNVSVIGFLKKREQPVYINVNNLNTCTGFFAV